MLPEYTNYDFSMNEDQVYLLFLRHSLHLEGPEKKQRKINIIIFLNNFIEKFKKNILFFINFHCSNLIIIKKKNSDNVGNKK